MAVMTPNNISDFAGLKISKATAPRSIFLAIYGTGGSGKTTLGAEVVNGLEEDGNPTLLVDIDRSSSSVIHLQDRGLNILPIETWNDALKILTAFKRGDTPFKAIMWDNISELLALCIRHYAPSGMPEGSAAIQTWGKINAAMMEFVRDMRTYCSRDGIHLIMVLWEEREKDKLTEIVRNKVLLNPAFAAAFPGMATMVGRLSVPGGEATNYVRLLDFAPDERFDTKFRVAPTEAAADIPLKLYVKQGSNFIVDFVNTVKYGKEFPKNKYTKPTRG